MTIILESKIYEVERIHNKTTANGFRDLKENDRIKITYNATASHHNRYAVWLYVHNLTTGQEWTINQNDLDKRLSCFRLKEV